MAFLKIVSEEQRIDKLSKDLRTAAFESDILQHVYSSHLVLLAAGHVEQSVIAVLFEYGRAHGNSHIKRFIEKSVERNNSLNCEKIKKILDLFDPSWWPQVQALSSDAERDAVDSLKTLRDQVAHGKRNGTGFSVVDGYCKEVRSFVRKVSLVVIGY